MAVCGLLFPGVFCVYKLLLLIFSDFPNIKNIAKVKSKLLTFVLKSCILTSGKEEKVMENGVENNYSCGILLKQIHDIQEKNINNALRDLDLTFTQVTILRTLLHSTDKQLSLKELEKMLHVAQSTTARITAKMENKGLIESFGDVSDKRIKYIHLTQYGEQYCINAKQKFEEENAHILSALTETEKLVFLSLLQKIINSLS